MQLTLNHKTALRYGENPHQKGWVAQDQAIDPLAFFHFQQKQGKQLSFNNYLDIDAAVDCLCYIGTKLPSCVIVKHTNPCGASCAVTTTKAFINAWDGDSLAAFGSIIAVNRPVDKKLALVMLADNRFFEVLVCPSISGEALTIFSSKPNLRILVNPALLKPKVYPRLDYKTIRGGMLIQEKNTKILKANQLKVVTKKKPTKKQLADLLFAWEMCRVSKANCIALVKDQKLIASGVGQQDRVRCCELAIAKGGLRSAGCVAASDAFFPFPDGPKILIESGVKAIIHPGGSIRDQLTIDLCNKHNIVLVTTGIRCFSH